MSKRWWQGLIGGVVLAAAWFGALAPAYPTYYMAWVNKYPTSTIPNRMLDSVGSICFTCHHPYDTSNAGTCYREDLKALLHEGHEIEDALDLLDGMDSDGDGVPNGVEITMPRDDLPGEVGYHAGLRGEFGVDPCGEDPDQIITGMPETPPNPCASFTPCDANCDGAVDFFDIDAFVLAVTDPDQYMIQYPACDSACVNDANGDGVVDFFDIDPFVACVIG